MRWSRRGRVLIVGYGRAGRRHGQTLDQLGVEWLAYDPYVAEAQLHTWAEVKREHWLASVVATPPRLHLGHAYLLCAAGIPTLIEKPLCGIGQAVARTRLMGAYVAYNYRFHAGLNQALRGGRQGHLHLQARQPIGTARHGVLLDFLPHDIDILRWIGGWLEIAEARALAGGRLWEVYGWVRAHRGAPTWQFVIEDGEWEGERRSELRIGERLVEIDADPRMFEAMWGDFLGERQRCVTIEEAVEGQRLLNEIAAKGLQL